MSPDAQIIHADLVFSINENNYWQDYQVQPVIKAQNGQMVREKTQVAETDYYVQIQSVNPGSGTVKLQVYSPDDAMGKGKDTFAVEVSEKPFISILWVGIILLIIGMVSTIIGRRKSFDQL